MTESFLGTESSNTRWLVVLMLFAFGAQWLVSWMQPSPGYYMMTDSALYWSNAASFLSEGKIADTYMPMGASICMALCQLVGFSEFEVVLWIHPLLNLLNVALTYCIVNHFVSGRWPLLAAALVACYPPQLNYARQLLSEPWFVTWLLATLSLMLRKGAFNAVLSGLLLGVCVLIRSQALGIWAVLLLASFMMGRSKKEWCLMLAASVSVIAAGCVIASVSAGRPLFLTQQSLMMTLYRSVPGGWEDIPEGQRQASYLAGLIYQPADFFKQRFWAFMNMMSPWPLDAGRSWKMKLFLAAVDLPLMITLVAAVIRQWRGFRLPPAAWLLVTPLVGLSLFHTLFFAVNRYRMPMMLMLIPFAVVFWAQVKPSERTAQ